MSVSAPALELENVCKSFGRIQAVDRLSLQVHPGEMVGFLGPNGAGKSTTLFMIAGLVRPTSGSIRIFGHDVRRQFRHAIESAGIMVEVPAFYEYLSGRKNLELAARLRVDASSRQIDTILEQIGLAARQHDKVSAYSQGMKQRLGLGMTLLGRPRLLLLDEPTNSLDPEATRDILTLLRDKVRSEGLAVFLSSHLLYEVEEFCDRVAVVNHGRLITAGRVCDILAPHEHVILVTFADSVPSPQVLEHLEGVVRATSVGECTLEITTGHCSSCRLNEQLIKAGLRVSALTPKQRSLKEFFLSVTGNANHENNDPSLNSK